MAAPYEIIASQLLRLNSRDHVAWNNWGAGLLNEALTLPDAVAEPQCQEAVRKFATASSIAPQNALYLVNWGAALSQQALRTPRENAEPLFRLALEKYQRAIYIAPHRSNTWKGMANCYYYWASKSDDSACTELYEAAYRRYAVAVERSEPDPSQALQEWGNALLNHALRLDSEDALRLLMEAVPIFERAESLQPDSTDTLNNGAVALTRLAQRLPDVSKAREWLAQAEQKLTHAVRLQPDTAMHYANRGLVLLLKSKQSPRSERKVLLEAADAEFILAKTFEGDSSLSLPNWAVVCVNRARIADSDDDAENMYAQANAIYAKAIKNQSSAADLWGQWGVLYTDWAVYGTSDRTEERLVEACEKFTVANSLKPNEVTTLGCWAQAIARRSHTSDPDTAHELVKEAEEKAQMAIRIKPDSPIGWSALGSVFLSRALREEDDAKRASFLEQAESHYRKTNEIKPVQGLYDLACVAALQNNISACRYWLEKSEEKETLPSPRLLAKEPDLASVRDEDWFRELMDRLPR